MSRKMTEADRRAALMSAFSIDEATAKTVRGLMRGIVDAVDILMEGNHDERNAGMLVSFRHSGPRPSDVMLAINRLVKGFGCEAIWSEDRSAAPWPNMEYVNMGDTYRTTIIYDYGTGRYSVGCWGGLDRIGRTEGVAVLLIFPLDMIVKRK